MGPQMGPKCACDADSLLSTQEVCWRPQKAMGLAEGEIQGGRFGRPGHFTKRALGHDQVLAQTRFCVRGSATSRGEAGQRDASDMDAARGSTATAPEALGPAK
jgi:hypothetical protein